MFYAEYGMKPATIECFDNRNPSLFKHIPAGNDVPPPPNPALEMAAAGHKHHMTGASDDTPKTPTAVDEDSSLRQPPANYAGIRNAHVPMMFSGLYPVDSGDYYYDFGGGAPAAADRRWNDADFYYQVQNQRNRYRKPEMLYPRVGGVGGGGSGVMDLALSRNKYGHGLDELSHKTADVAASPLGTNRRVMTSSFDDSNKHANIKHIMNEPQRIPATDRVVNGNKNAVHSGLVTNRGSLGNKWRSGRKSRA